MANLADQIEQTKAAFLSQLDSCDTHENLEHLRITFLGRSGKLTDLMTQLRQLSDDDKRTLGPALNQLKAELTRLFDAKKNELTTAQLRAHEQQFKHFDVTAHLPLEPHGSLHPYTQLINQLTDIFTSMGFAIADGPEVETQYYNFETLNIPADHPARDLHDTFFLNVPDMVMRTHTSTVQAHVMEQQEPPIAIVAPGRCYRHEATDATHDIMFMQCEGLLIDTDVSMSNLIATVKTCFAAIFNKHDLSVRIRPSYYPFVEPGIDIDISCPFCQSGCSVCKKTGWIEAGGAGLVHPNVLECSGLDANTYSGFAFGFGLTRLVMIQHGINDIRLLHNPKIEFLNQFR